jgi:hypothetical protein
MLPSVLRWSTDFAAILRLGRVQFRLMGIPQADASDLQARYKGTNFTSYRV